MYITMYLQLHKIKQSIKIHKYKLSQSKINKNELNKEKI